MANRALLTVFLLPCLIFMIAISDTAAFGQSSISSTPSPASQPSQQEQPPPLHQSLSPTSIFEPILNHLGFHELAMAVPSLQDHSPSFSTWRGPSTVFAPTDASVNSCESCSLHSLLSEHIVPGLYSFSYLQTLRFGTKVETMSSGHCLTITSSANRGANSSRIFIDGVEITYPDMFNNGLVVVHGLDGFVSALSPFSCSVEKVSPPPVQAPAQPPEMLPPPPPPPPSAVMDLMLRDAMRRLRTTGYGILALAMRIKYPDLVALDNATLFAMDDSSIFSGYQSYVSNIRFHIVPNQFLTIEELSELPTGTVLPTLNRGQYLVVTTSSIGSSSISINYVQIRSPEVVMNLKIVAHSLFMPFLRLHPTSVSSLVVSQMQINKTLTDPDRTTS